MKNTIFHIPKNISLQKDIVKYFPLSIQKRFPEEIAVIAVSPQQSLKLNRTYRNKRTPTNVLSFLYTTPLSSPRKRGSRSRESGFPIKSGMTKGKRNSNEYGEIIVCPAIIRKDAKKQGNSYAYQMTWMIVHGMLHLSGMHHETSRMTAQRVDHLEKKILHLIFSPLKSEARNLKS